MSKRLSRRTSARGDRKDVRSIGRSLRRYEYRLRSANQVRTALVLGVLVFQSFEVSESYNRVLSSPLWILPSILIPALFALIGFLLAQSSETRPAKTFFARRLLLVLPVLIMTVVISAAFIGPLVTIGSRTSYFTDDDVWLYLLNIVGWPHFALPGVFEFNNTSGVVNAPLWTSAIYLGTVAIIGIAVRWRRHATLFLGAILLGLLILALIADTADLGLSSYSFGNVIRLTSTPLTASICGLGGAIVYFQRDRIRSDGRWAIGAAAIIAAIAWVGNRTWGDFALFNGLIALPIVYLTIYCSSRSLSAGDVSQVAQKYLYGLFLYSYPIQQFWIATGPSPQTGVVNLLLTVPVVALFAIGSWHLIERPLRSRLGVAPVRASTTSPDSPVIFRRRPARYYAAKLQSQIPFLLAAAALIVVILAVMALTMFAMQRDAGGA